jgi:carbon-monoxide dehydrogenase small subunit
MMSDSTTVRIRTTINGGSIELDVDPNESLASLLRERLGLTGLKLSCGVQICGACTVLLDDRAVSACTVLAVEADARAVRTVEGLANNHELNDLQTAFARRGALQCGFCTPGFLMTATELLERIDHPDEATVRHWLSGNICRCTGYRSIIDAVHDAAAARTERRKPDG